MAKKFNYTGTCIPGKHYMADTSAKLARIMQFVEDGEYFSINRPRQYGKSTTMNLLETDLEKKGYLPVYISFEGIGDAAFEDEAHFSGAFVNLCSMILKYSEPHLSEYVAAREKPVSLDELSVLISDLVTTAGKRVVLMIDEVDKSSNNQLFVSFLAMLRDKFLLRNRGKGAAFHSVILAGVHDVKNLKLKLRPDEEKKYNSPWNIAIDFTVDMAFSAQEIESMLRDFADERNLEMDIPHIAAQLHYYTAGYPFLVSKLCYIVDTYIKEETGSNEWTDTDIEAAVKHILRESNTNFDSLIKNLENNRDLYDLVESILMEGIKVEFNRQSSVISHGLTYGIFKADSTVVEIHNPIYQQLLYNYMTTNLAVKNSITRKVGEYNFQGNYILPGNKLDFRQILLKFQEFMREQYSEKEREFLERNGRLVFLAFLKPIINGRGFDFKEVQISEEKRLDVVVTFYSHRYVVELKKWYGPEAHERGLMQLSDYLDRQGLDEGFLIIFDFRNKKEWKQQDMKAREKDVFAVWV